MQEIKFYIEEGELVGRDNEGSEYCLEFYNSVTEEYSEVKLVKFVDNNPKKVDVKHEE